MNFDRMHNRMRIGIIGAGLMGRWHAHAAQAAGMAVTAIADPAGDRARRLAAKYKAVQYGSAGDMISDAPLDVLHICAPTSEHFDLGTEVLRQSIHVFIEKPLTETAEQTSALINLADSVERLVCPAHQYAFERSVMKMISCFERIGDPVSLELRFFSAGADHSSPEAFPIIASDILPHPLSIVQRFFPNTPLVSCDWRIQSVGLGEWECAALIEGVYVRIIIGVKSRPTLAQAMLRGTKGSFEADLFHDYVIWRDGTATRRTKIVQPFSSAAAHSAAAGANLIFRAISNEPAYPGLKLLLEKFYAACAGAGEPPISNGCILDVAKMRDRFMRAIMEVPDVQSMQLGPGI